EHIDRFSEQGLRTLLFAGRFMTEEEYTTWNDKYVAASLLSEGRDTALKKLAAALERGREAALKMLAAALEEGHDADNQESYLFNTSCKFTPRLLIHGVSALEALFNTRCKFTPRLLIHGVSALEVPLPSEDVTQS
ncbi:hypothetical protein T484DRAFT_1841236, partial [Baffinella frigidus]